jgi:uncharacterized protein YkwD
MAPKFPLVTFLTFFSEPAIAGGTPGGGIAMMSKLCVTTLIAMVLFVQATFAVAEDAKQTQANEDKTSTSTADSAKDGQKLIEVEKQMMDQINAQRAKYGLPPLAVDQSLEKTARSHAVWMTNNRALQHTNANVGENIAMGQRTTGEAVNDWMNSPGHRANILNSSYKRTGVAAYQTPDGTVYWCQQFLP